MTFSNRLLKTISKDIKMSNGKTLEENLYIEAERLCNCIQARLDLYLASYTPKIYERTGGLISSLKVDDFMSIKVVGNALEISLFFDENAIHQSGDGILEWDGNGEKVNTAFLLNYGYNVKKDVWFKKIENFGWRTGGNFIEDGIADFNNTNPMGIKITIKSNGYLE